MVAIVCAFQVDGKFASCDFQEAYSSSNQAKIWGSVSMGLVIFGFVCNLLYLLFALVYDAASYLRHFTIQNDNYGPYNY